VDELTRGVYRRADATETAHADLLAVHTRAPHAVICGESALALHELIDDIPAAVHIAVPRGTRRPAISYPPIVVAQYALRAFDLNIEQYEAAAGEFVSDLQQIARELNALSLIRPAVEAVLA